LPPLIFRLIAFDEIERPVPFSATVIAQYSRALLGTQISPRCRQRPVSPRERAPTKTKPALLVGTSPGGARIIVDFPAPVWPKVFDELAIVSTLQSTA